MSRERADRKTGRPRREGDAQEMRPRQTRSSYYIPNSDRRSALADSGSQAAWAIARDDGLRYVGGRVGHDGKSVCLPWIACVVYQRWPALATAPPGTQRRVGLTGEDGRQGAGGRRGSLRRRWSGAGLRKAGEAGMWARRIEAGARTERQTQERCVWPRRELYTLCAVGG